MPTRGERKAAFEAAEIKRQLQSLRTGDAQVITEMRKIGFRTYEFRSKCICGRSYTRKAGENYSGPLQRCSQCGRLFMLERVCMQENSACIESGEWAPGWVSREVFLDSGGQDANQG